MHPIDTPIELAPGQRDETLPAPDLRPAMPPPPPVRLLTLIDATLPAASGIEPELDAFYVGLLEFEREAGDHVVYRGDKYRLRFEMVEAPLHRDCMRPLGIEVASLAAVEGRLIERQIEMEHQRGMPGDHRIIVRDPAGNFLALSEARRIL